MPNSGDVWCKDVRLFLNITGLKDTCAVLNGFLKKSELKNKKQNTTYIKQQPRLNEI